MSARKLGARSGGTGPVLVVEDDPDIRQAMADLLEDDGYECLLAEHGLDALEALQRRTPSLLLVDLVMPVMNGVELIARLRADARWRKLPIVVMTAEGQRIIGVDLESLDVRVLKKPVDIASLAQVLAEHSSVSAWPHEGA
jgi:two-component system, chemotaxis family, chemotaxis protein CheY